MLTWLRRLFARLLPTTLAGRASASTALLLAIMFAVAAISYLFKPGARPFLEVWWPERIGFGLLLLILLPLVVYFGVRYWNRVEESLYPDIDEAWQAGIEALRNAGLSLDSAPMFLLLGGSDVEDAFAGAMRAGGVAFRVERAPGAAGVTPALRWYASDSAIYLFSPRVGALSSLAQSWASSPTAQASSSVAWTTRQSASSARQLSSRAAYQAPLRTITPWDLPEELRNFVRLLIANDRLGLLPDIHAQFVQLKNEHDGVVEAEIRTAFPLDNRQLAGLVADLERRFRHRVQPRVSQDKELIGGVRISVGDSIIDGSVRGKLEGMAAALKG